MWKRGSRRRRGCHGALLLLLFVFVVVPIVVVRLLRSCFLEGIEPGGFGFSLL
jgi:hypothetical protein